MVSEIHSAYSDDKLTFHVCLNNTQISSAVAISFAKLGSSSSPFAFVFRDGAPCRSVIAFVTNGASRVRERLEVPIAESPHSYDTRVRFEGLSLGVTIRFTDALIGPYHVPVPLSTTPPRTPDVSFLRALAQPLVRPPFDAPLPPLPPVPGSGSPFQVRVGFFLRTPTRTAPMDVVVTLQSSRGKLLPLRRTGATLRAATPHMLCNHKSAVSGAATLRFCAPEHPAVLYACADLEACNMRVAALQCSDLLLRVTVISDAETVASKVPLGEVAHMAVGDASLQIATDVRLVVPPCSELCSHTLEALSAISRGSPAYLADLVSQNISFAAQPPDAPDRRAPEEMAKSFGAQQLFSILCGHNSGTLLRPPTACALRDALNSRADTSLALAVVTFSVSRHRFNIPRLAAATMEGVPTELLANGWHTAGAYNAEAAFAILAKETTALRDRPDTFEKMDALADTLWRFVVLRALLVFVYANTGVFHQCPNPFAAAEAALDTQAQSGRAMCSLVIGFAGAARHCELTPAVLRTLTFLCAPPTTFGFLGAVAHLEGFPFALPPCITNCPDTNRALLDAAIYFGPRDPETIRAIAQPLLARFIALKECIGRENIARDAPCVAVADRIETLLEAIIKTGGALPDPVICSALGASSCAAEVLLQFFLEHAHTGTDALAQLLPRALTVADSASLQKLGLQCLDTPRCSTLCTRVLDAIVPVAAKRSDRQLSALFILCLLSFDRLEFTAFRDVADALLSGARVRAPFPDLLRVFFVEQRADKTPSGDFTKLFGACLRAIIELAAAGSVSRKEITTCLSQVISLDVSEPARPALRALTLALSEFARALIPRSSGSAGVFPIMAPPESSRLSRTSSALLYHTPRQHGSHSRGLIDKLFNRLRSTSRSKRDTGTPEPGSEEVIEFGSLDFLDDPLEFLSGPMSDDELLHTSSRYVTVAAALHTCALPGAGAVYGHIASVMHDAIPAMAARALSLKARADSSYAEGPLLDIVQALSLALGLPSLTDPDVGPSPRANIPGAPRDALHSIDLFVAAGEPAAALREFERVERPLGQAGLSPEERLGLESARAALRKVCESAPLDRSLAVSFLIGFWQDVPGTPSAFSVHVLPPSTTLAAFRRRVRDRWGARVVQMPGSVRAHTLAPLETCEPSNCAQFFHAHAQGAPGAARFVFHLATPLAGHGRVVNKQQVFVGSPPHMVCIVPKSAHEVEDGARKSELRCFAPVLEATVALPGALTPAASALYARGVFVDAETEVSFRWVRLDTAITLALESARARAKALKAALVAALGAPDAATRAAAIGASLLDIAGFAAHGVPRGRTGVATARTVLAHARKVAARREVNGAQLLPSVEACQRALDGYHKSLRGLLSAVEVAEAAAGDDLGPAVLSVAMQLRAAEARAQGSA